MIKRVQRKANEWMGYKLWRLPAVRRLLAVATPFCPFCRKLFNRSFIDLTKKAGWGVHPQSMHFITRLVRQHHPQLIVDCGTGLGHSLAAELCGILSNKGGRVISLEHDSQYAPQAQAKFKGWDAVSIVVVPLKPDNAYDFQPESPIDLLVVDGPPMALTNGRLNTIRHFMPFLAEKGIILLDDLGREQEQQIVQTVVGEFGLQVEVIPEGHHMAILRKP